MATTKGINSRLNVYFWLGSWSVKIVDQTVMFTVKGRQNDMIFFDHRTNTKQAADIFLSQSNWYEDTALRKIFSQEAKVIVMEQFGRRTIHLYDVDGPIDGYLLQRYQTFSQYDMSVSYLGNRSVLYWVEDANNWEGYHIISLTTSHQTLTCNLYNRYTDAQCVVTISDTYTEKYQ